MASDKNPRNPRPDDQEELVQVDDAAVGRAFRRSLFALVVILILGGGAFLALRKKPEAKPVQMTSITTPRACPTAMAVLMLRWKKSFSTIG